MIKRRHWHRPPSAAGKLCGIVTASHPRKSITLAKADFLPSAMPAINLSFCIRAGVSFMWCQSCRQDVPGLADGVDGRYACPRCGEVMTTDAGIDLSVELETLQTLRSHHVDRTPDAATSAEPPPSAEAEEPPVFERIVPPHAEPSRVTSLRWDAANWELNEKLRHVERMTSISRRRYDAPPTPIVGGPHAAWTPSPNGYPQSAAQPVAPYAQPVWPAGYAAPPGPTNPYAPVGYPPPQPAPQETYERNVRSFGPAQLLLTLVSWLFLGGAITAFTCGGFLAAWGGLNQNQSVQQLGMPIILLGMISLVIGLLPQIFLRRIAEHDAWTIAEDRRYVGAPHASFADSERFRMPQDDVSNRDYGR